jgi:hypothetical protein
MDRYSGRSKGFGFVTLADDAGAVKAIAELHEKIIFDNAKDAASHLNAIWKDPDQWWESAGVVHARDEFRRSALDGNRDGLDAWVSYIERMVA